MKNNIFQVLESSSEEEEDEDPALEAMRAQLAKDTSMVRKLKSYLFLIILK